MAPVLEIANGAERRPFCLHQVFSSTDGYPIVPSAGGTPHEPILADWPKTERRESTSALLFGYKACGLRSHRSKVRFGRGFLAFSLSSASQVPISNFSAELNWS